MANNLKMTTIDTIQRLHKAGLSNREIARTTGVHRQTSGPVSGGGRRNFKIVHCAPRVGGVRRV